MDPENTLKERHAALFLRPAVFEEFRALTKQHMRNEGTLNLDDQRAFTASFLVRISLTLLS